MPPQHDLAALADELVADIKHYYDGVSLDEQRARALRGDLIRVLTNVHLEASRAFLGSPLRRGRGDD
jgi:hypothetical protein